MWMMRCPNGIDSNPQIPICTIFESDRTRQTGSQFAVNLTFGCPRADGAPTNEIRNVLGRDDVEVLNTGRHSRFVQLDQKSPSRPQALVNLKTAIQTRIVDETFPAHSCSWFFEIHTHDNQQVGLEPIL